jgi:type IV secretory pathway ATPase VirB11/archaellum biosynthesis ATPase
MGNEGIEEILKEYRKRQKGNNESNQDLSVSKIEAKEINVEKQKSPPQEIEVVLSDKNQYTSFSDKTYNRNYVIAKSPENYTQSMRISKLSQIEKEKTETRIILKKNGITVVSAFLDPATNKYDVKEIELNADEEKTIKSYEMLHKLTEHVNMKGKLIDVFESIKKEIDSFLIEQNEKTSLVRTEVIAYYMLKNYGYYELTPLLMDNKIEDINGIEGTNIVIHDSSYLNDFIVNIFLSRQNMDKLLKKFSEYGSNPITPQVLNVSVTLPEGSRFNCIYPYENEGKMSFSARKQVFSIISPQQSMDGNFVTIDELAFLGWVMQHSELGKLGFIGLPGSGKTSFLKTMSLFIPLNSRVFSIETTPELLLKQKSWAQNVYVFEPEKQAKLLSASMQYRPDYLIVGEVKLEKELVDNLFSAMSSGFKTMFTFHSEDTMSFIAKMQSRALEIARDRIANINFLLFIVEDRSIKKRYLSNIDEIYGYDSDKDRVLHQTLIKTKLRYGKQKEIEPLCSVQETDNDKKLEKEIEVYNTFLKLEKITDIKPINNQSQPDILLEMLLKSRAIENYVKIYGIGEENQQYSETQLRYSKEYIKIFNQMRGIRSFLAVEYVKYENMPSETKLSTAVDTFMQDYQNYINTTQES